MMVQAVNMLPTMPYYNAAQTMSKDSGCDFESFLTDSDVSVAKAERQDPVSVKKNGNSEADVKGTGEHADVAESGRSEATLGTDTEAAEITETQPDKAENVESDALEEVPSEEDAEELLMPSEQLFAEILSVLRQIVMTLQDELQVTEQQLFGAMDELQFQVTDFFDADKIKELFMQVNEADAAALLTDESLYVELQQLQNLLEDVVGDSDLYSLLQQEGFEAESFEMSMLETQITKNA